MLNFYLKDQSYILLPTPEKTYLLAILINNYNSKTGLHTWSGSFKNININLGDIFFEAGFTSQTDKSTVPKSQGCFQ